MKDWKWAATLPSTTDLCQAHFEYSEISGLFLPFIEAIHFDEEAELFAVGFREGRPIEYQILTKALARIGITYTNMVDSFKEFMRIGSMVVTVDNGAVQTGLIASDLSEYPEGDDAADFRLILRLSSNSSDYALFAVGEAAILNYPDHKMTFASLDGKRFSPIRSAYDSYNTVRNLA